MGGAQLHGKAKRKSYGEGHLGQTQNKKVRDKLKKDRSYGEFDQELDV